MGLVHRDDSRRYFGLVLPVGRAADRTLGRVAHSRKRFRDGQKWAIADYDLRGNSRPLEHQTTPAYLANVNIDPRIRAQRMGGTSSVCVGSPGNGFDCVCVLQVPPKTIVRRFHCKPHTVALKRLYSIPRCTFWRLRRNTYAVDDRLSTCRLHVCAYFPSRRRRWLLLCTVGIVLAFLTKSVQGLIFLPALLIYAVRYIPIIEILRSPAAYVSGATVLLSFAGYYFTREQIDPGYFAAAMANDPGRFVTVLDYNVLGPLYYIQSFPLIFLSLLFAGFQLCRARGERRQISIYLGVMSLFYLLIISLSATQLPWYAVPLLPLNAMIIAVAIDEPFEWMIMRWRWFRLMTNRALVPVCVLAGLGVIAQNVHRLTLREERVIDDERNLTNVFLRSHPVHYAILQKFVVIQQSYRSDEFFVAPTLFYVNGLRWPVTP